MFAVIIKGLLGHKRRVLATSSAVMLGVAFLTASLAVGDTLTSGFDRLFRDANAGTDLVVRDEHVIGSEENTMRRPLDRSLAEVLVAVDGVAEVAPVIEGYGQLLAADGSPIGGNGPPTTAANWLGDGAINPWRLAEGRAPVATVDGAPIEVVIDRGAATTGDLAIGDTTVMRIPEPVDVRIVGLATIAGADSLGPTTYTALADDVAARITESPGQVSSFRIVADGGLDVEVLRSRIDAVLPADAETLTAAELSAEMVADIESDFLGLFKAILIAFAGVALVVAAFSIYNTFSIVVAQRSRESSLLRAVGASRRQVLSSVVAEALAIGGTASAIGVGVGVLVATGFSRLLERASLDLNDDGLTLTATTVALAFGVGVIATVASSVVPALRAAKVSPLEALRAPTASPTTRATVVRIALGALAVATGLVVLVTATSADSALQQAGLGALAVLSGAVVLGPVVARPAASAIGAIPAMLPGRSGHLARVNAMRDPKRTAASASPLLIGAAVVGLFTTFGSSLNATVENMVDRDFGGDLVVVPDDFGGAGLPLGLAPDIDALPEVRSAVGLANGVVLIDGDEVETTIADAAELSAVLDLGLVEGSFDAVGPGALALSEEAAAERRLSIGDDIAATFGDGETTDFVLAATYANTMNAGAIVMSPADWTPHARQDGLVVVLIDLFDDVSESDGVAAVGEVTERSGAPGVQTRSEYIDSVASEIDQMLLFVYGMLAIAILIALMGIANTLSLSIHERTRELGLLRAVGQTRRQVRATVRWESVIVAVFGTIGGVGLGTFLAWGLMRALAAEEGFGDFAVPTGSLAIVVGLAIVAGVAAAWRPAQRAARTDILTAIATD